MELIQIFRILLRRWYLVLIPVIIAAVFVVPDFLASRAVPTGGFTTTIHFTAAHDSNTTLPPRDGDFQDIWIASELTVNALSDWIETSLFAQEVAAVANAQGANIDPAALRIVGDSERSIGQLTLEWTNEEELRTLIAAVITVLETRTQAYFPQLGDQPAQVRVMDEPRIVPVAPPIANRFAPLIRIGLALVAGIGLAFLVEYLDPTLRRRDQLEAVGLPVIASIPRHR